jgi:acetyltransferase-like isoleucine patch superfamily enzyme
MKAALKVTANGLALALVLPAFLLYRLATLVVGPARAFPGWSELFSLIPGRTGAYLRRAFYRLVLPSVGADAWIGFGTVIASPNAEIGRGVYVGPFCVLGDVTLGDDVLLGSNVSVMNGSAQHGTDRLDVPIRDQPGVWPRVAIGRDSWVGDRSIVMTDVGSHCVIGAGSLVTRPIPDYAVAFGSPARVVRYRGGDRDPIGADEIHFSSN